MRRIMHILTGTKFSGAENVVCQIISCFRNDPEYEMFFCSPDGQIRESLKERSVRFSPMKEWTLAEVKRLIHEEKPDIIHAHDMKASFFAALVCGKTSLITHIHNNNFDSRGISLKSLLYCYAAKKAKHIFWVSTSAYEGYAFHKQFENKSSILCNVIDSEAVYRKVDEDSNDYRYDIVYVGRLTYPKNPQRLVKVLAGVAKKFPSVRTAIIGSGDLEAETKLAISEHRVESYVEMLGYISNPYKVMSQAKILIMTSRWEGLPMCALEAMALGIPIVSTPTDGLKEIVEDGKTGYLSDDDEILINRCADILNDEDLYQRLRQKTLEKATKILDIKSYKAILGKVYQQCR